MTTDFVQRHRQLKNGFRQLGELHPDLMAGFGSLHKSATADGVLPQATKELIALAVSITSHCDGCIAFHTHDAIQAGATREEIVETIGVAVLMGGGPAVVYGSDALDALEQFEAA